MGLCPEGVPSEIPPNIILLGLGRHMLVEVEGLTADRRG